MIRLVRISVLAKIKIACTLFSKHALSIILRLRKKNTSDALNYLTNERTNERTKSMSFMASFWSKWDRIWMMTIASLLSFFFLLLCHLLISSVNVNEVVWRNHKWHTQSKNATNQIFLQNRDKNLRVWKKMFLAKNKTCLLLEKGLYRIYRRMFF